MGVKVSIIIAANSDEHNLKNALDSIKNQSFKDIEVIMIDAAGTDSLAAIMKSYCTDKRFIYQRIENNSISNARNIGMAQAKGKYLAFADASVVFSKRVVENMYECAEKENAQLCVAPMASSDIYGKHEFKSSGILSRRKRTNKFDTDLIWNPAVTNKLFLKSKVEQLNLKFNAFGKAREAAFSLPFAFESDVIVSSSKGAVSYIIPVHNDGVAQFPIEHYLDAYKLIIELAEKSFDNEISKSITDFDRKEMKKIKVCYIDQVILKEITVLLYSYYRHFWSLEDAEIKTYTQIITSLIDNLSSSGKKALLEKNKDIFYNGKLIDNKQEMAENPKVTVCIGKSEKRGHLHERRLLVQVTSIFNQTMPGFRLLVDERLRDIFPKQWIDFPNVEFIQAGSLSEFKDLALEKCQTKYIMYQDGFARLNPKILMRHYVALTGREKYGFTTSPLTQFDGTKTKEYSFSDLSFYSDMNVTRASESNNAFVLDLFFCNKLFRTDHLNGIHFSFTDNPVIDMYKLYEHSRFKKLLHRGAYLPYNEEEALILLKSEQKYLPNECKIIYKKYKSVYRKRVTRKKRADKFIKFAKRVKRFAVSVIEKILIFIFSHMKIKNRVLFYTIRSNGKLLENSRFVYESCDQSKVVFAKMLPHSFIDACKAKMYMLTSKVIVTDDYLKYLRSIKLRDGQKVIQIWHASGAFKRFGLDAPSRLSRYEEYSTHSQYSDVCVSSEYVRQFYAHAFGVDIDVVKALGSPRTDGVVDQNEREDKRAQMIARHPLLKDKKVYVYFPTFREIDGTLNDFDPQIDWSQLNDDLADDEVFIISRHPVMKKEFFKSIFYSRVKDYTFEPSPDLLAIADVVITDYSSIIFDASLINIPLVFYCPDYDTYEREFYLNFEEDLPGEIVKNCDKLLSSIRAANLGGTETEEMKAFKQREVGACDGHSTERVVNLINSYLN